MTVAARCRGGEGGHPCSLWQGSPAVDGERGSETPCVRCEAFTEALGLIVCPRCEGQQYDRGSCGVCRSRGLLNDLGDPLSAGEETRLWDAILRAGGRAAHAADCDCGDCVPECDTHSLGEMLFAGTSQQGAVCGRCKRFLPC